MADTKKVTKKEMFNAILAVEGITPEMQNFIKHEIELLTKKNSAKKPNAKQKENVGVKADIVSALANLGVPVTVSTLRKSSDKLIDFESQKISALLRQLVESGEVVRTLDGKTAMFSLAENGDTDSAEVAD